MQLQGMNHNNAPYDRPDLSSLLSIVMPVRIDSDERMANLKAVLRHVCALGCRVILLEADVQSAFKDSNEIDTETMKCIKHEFVVDSSLVFHRTKYINRLLNETDTEIVAVWDADILIAYHQVYEAVDNILKGCTIAYPYNGEYVMLSERESDVVRWNFDIENLKSLKLQSVFGRPFCGGVFLVHRQRYLQCGGENEHFTGWGPEDAERLRRVGLLGHSVKWTEEGQAYHLNHSRGKNSDFYSKEDAIRLRKELVKVCSMEKGELQDYITGKSWK